MSIQQAKMSSIIRTPDQRLRVFISSTLRELAPEREAARRAVSELRFVPVMFEAGARPHSADDLYRAYLAQSHIFLGIYWQSYGWVAPGMDISGLEDELQRAEELPKLIYIKSPAPERQPELASLLQKIKDKNDVSYKYFSDAAELEELIGNDLALFLTEQFEQAQQASKRPVKIEEDKLIDQKNGRANLPQPISTIIGREKDVTAVQELLSQPTVRLVTLLGPGGVGKTRLALETASRLANHFENGIYWVNLAPIRQQDLVISAIAQVLNVREREGRPLLESLKTYLRQKQMLLLLDNFEQVTKAAPILSDLLETAQGLKILVTSRILLNLRGEQAYPVHPLGVPDMLQAESEQLLNSAAVRLFVERGQAVRPDFRLTSKNSRDIIEIVQRLDGLPLAIELAAARLNLLPPHLILKRLDDRLKLLTGGPHDLPDRQQTMRNALDWSYGLLSPKNQQLFGRLGVFVDGFTLEAAEAVCNPDDDLDVFEGVASLLDNSLLLQGALVDDQPRFAMLETVREYADERLTRAGEKALFQQQHAQFFADYALLGREKLFSGKMSMGESERWLDRLNADLGNFRAVIEWAAQSEKNQPLSWPLIPGLVWFTYRRGYLNEARQWCKKAIEQTAELGDDPLRASIFVHAGLVAMWQSDLVTAEKLMDDGVAMMRRVGDKNGMMDVLFPRGVLAVNQSQVEEASKIFNEGLPLFEEAGLTWFQAMIHLHQGNVVFFQGELAKAKVYTEKAHLLGAQIGDPWIVASAVNNFGELARYQANYEPSERFYLESRELFRQINSSPDIARADHSLAWMHLARGDGPQARTLFQQALALHEQLGIKRGVVECLAGLAAGLVKLEPEKAVRLFSAVRARFDDLGTKPWPADEQEIERYLAIAHASLEEAQFSAAWEQGQKIPFFQALEEANSFKTRPSAR